MSNRSKQWLMAAPSLPAFAAFSIISVVAVPFSSDLRYFTPYRLLLNTGLGLLVTAVAGAIIFAFAIAIKRLSLQPILHAVLTVTSFAVAGAARGYLFFDLSDEFQLFSMTTFPLRMFNSTMTTVFWMSICSIGFQSHHLYRKRLEGLLGQALLKRYHTITRSDLNDQLLGIEDRLRDLKIAEGENQQDALSRAAHDVRDLISQHIRPLSHRLWLRGKSSIPQVNYLALMRDSLSQMSFSARRVTIFYAITSFVNASTGLGVIDACARTGTGIVVFLSVVWIYRKFSQIRFNNILFLVAAGLSTAITQEITAQLLGLPLIIGLSIIYSPYIPAIIVLDSMATLASADRKQLLSDLQNAINQNGDEIESAHVASYLHNSLQNELLALATQLESAAHLPLENQLKSIEQLGAFINRSISEDFAAFNTSTTERIFKTVNAWEGILEIKLDFDPEKFESDTRSSVIAQLLEETASNAIRHGGANWLSMSLAVTPDNSWQITFHNDGKLDAHQTNMGTDWTVKNTVLHKYEETAAGVVITYLIA